MRHLQPNDNFNKCDLLVETSQLGKNDNYANIPILMGIWQYSNYY